MTKSDMNHNEHWANTVRGLDLRGFLIAGMALFIAYFEIRKMERPLPSWFLLDPYLSAGCFAVVVSRCHLMSSIEPEMAAWWDRTIGRAARRYRITDYALEGPWLFLLMALPFSSISAVIFGLAYAAWSVLEVIYLRIGLHALRIDGMPSLEATKMEGLNKYYIVRIQHEAGAAVLALGVSFFGALAALHHGHASTYLVGCWLCISGLLTLVTAIEVSRNPWYFGNLEVADQ